MELIFAGSITVLALGSLALIMVQTAVEQRQGLAQASLEQEANHVVDRLAVLLRSMSASESALFGNPLTSNPNYYRRLIVAQGESASQPREEILFVANLNCLLHRSDVTRTNVVVLSAPSATSVLRDLYFYPSFKNDGSLDSTTLNVALRVDDNGYGGRRSPLGTSRPFSVSRYFAVKMRNR
jgi:hypothetical protein